MRADLDLSAFAHLAPQLIVVGRGQAGLYPFRLVGGLVRDLHGRRLLGENLMDLFTLNSRTELRPALEAARRGRAMLVAGVTGRSVTGQSVTLELLFAPLAGPSGDVDRFLGLYQPLTPLIGLRGERLADLVITSLHAGETDAPRLRLAALDGRQIAS